MRIKSFTLKQIVGVCLLSLGIFLAPFTSIAIAVQESPTPTLYSQGWWNSLSLKDWLDVVTSLLVPVSVAWFGWRYKKLERDSEDRRNEEEKERQTYWKKEEKQREDQRTQLAKAELISTFMKSLISENKKEQLLAITSIVRTFQGSEDGFGSEEGFGSLIKEIVLQKDEQRQQTEEQLENSLTIGILNNLVSSRYELYHLYRLYEAEKQNKPYKVSRRGTFLSELRNLRNLGLLENQKGKAIGGMPPYPQKVDLRDYVRVTKNAEQYIQQREDYGLYNPRKKGNSEFWDSLNQAA